LSNNSTEKKDRKFFFRRKGEMQGTSAPTTLSFARFTNSVVAHIPNPPDYTDFYFLQLVGIPTTYLSIETETSDDVVEITSPEVSHILAQIEATTPCSASFSNRLITISGPAAGGWVKIKPYDTDKTLDAARLLGFAYGEFFPAYSKEGWDAPAPGKNKETFVQRYENNISDAVNRGLSALASNIEEHHRFLSEELVVPRLVNTVEHSDILDTWEDADNVLGLILKDRAYVSDIKEHSPASIERFFVLTDKFGACSITVGDREEPVRICDVTTGEPIPATPLRRTPYFTDLGATTEYAATGDGKSVLGLPQQGSQGLIGSFTVSNVLDNSKIQVNESTAEIYPGCKVLWPGDDLNSGEYTVVSVNSDVIELLATDSGRDSLVVEPPLGGSVAIFHSTVISIDISSDQLYLLFDTPISKTSTAALHGFGLLYGARTTVKDFLTTTLMGNLKGQAVSDIVVRSLQAIRGPNSRNYRSTRVGDPDGYDGDIDTSADGGDLISLETLANRSLLGRDVFDLSGGATESDSPSDYTITDGSRANAFAGNPLTLYGDATPVADEFSLVANAVDVDSDKWTSRLGGSGPFNGKLNNGGVLQAGDKFLPTDVGLTVKISEADGIVANAGQKQLLRVWTISKYISPDRVLLTCPDLPSYLPYAVDDLFVQFKFGAREVRNLSAGSLLRLDKTTSDDAQFDGAKVNALVLADTAGITGVVTITPIAHTASNFAKKLSFSTTSNNHLELDLSFANNSNFIYELHPQDKDQPLVPSLVNTADLDGLDDGSWTTQVIGAYTLVTFKHTPVMGATVVEVVSVDGTFDGLLLVKKVQISSTGNYFLHLCDFALNDVVVPTGTLGTCRLYNLNVAHALRSSDKKWAGPSADSLAFNSFFGTGRTFGGSSSEVNGTVARFGGNGSLDSVVEIRASGDSPFLALGPGGGAKVYVPRTALNVWASSPSQGIEVNTATSDNPGIRDVFGGTGVRIISFTGFRAHREDLGAIVYPGSAALIATQLYDADHEVRNDPVKRDPVAIFATEVRPSSTLTSEPDFATRVVVPDTYDTNAQVISYVCDDVYQTSDQRVHWSVYIFENGIIDESYVLVSNTDIGYVDYEVTIAAGASNSVTVNSADKKLEIVIAGTPYTASELVTAINALTQFTAVCSNTGGWNISIASLIGTGSLSERAAALHPTSISQSKINTAIEAIKGDIVVTDGIFAIQEQEGALTGVGSHLIPVNPEVPLQPSLADDLDVSTGYDLGEPEIVWSAPDKLVVLGDTKIALFAVGSEESHVNRRLDITFDGDTITRYITGLEGGYYTLNQPVVFPGWSGVSTEVIVSVTLYGRRWRNIYAQHIESSTLNVGLVENLNVENLTVENVVATNTVVDSLRVRGWRRKFIPASSFTKDVNPYPLSSLYAAVKFQNKTGLTTGLGGNPTLDPSVPSSIGWFLDLPVETTFEPANTAKLLHCWSPEIANDEYDLDEHTPENPVQYEIAGVTVYYRYFGEEDLSAIDIEFTTPDTQINYALLSIRTHYYDTDLTDLNWVNFAPFPSYWFAGGYDNPISSGSSGALFLTNSAFSAVEEAPPDGHIITMQAGPVLPFAGYASFEVVLRPQFLFSGLSFAYRKVVP
jgi:hypothetical protein